MKTTNHYFKWILLKKLLIGPANWINHFKIRGKKFDALDRKPVKN